MKEGKRFEEKEKAIIKRVIFEHEDGTVSYLERDDAQKWEKVMNGLVTLGFTHGKQGQTELASLEYKYATNLQELKTKISK